MTLTLLKSKLHRVRATGAEPDYEGSLTLDPDWMEAVGILPWERILVADVENGNRFETYAIPGERGAGQCRLNGAAAHLGKAGDRLIVMAFAQMPPEEAANFTPKTMHFG